MSKTLLLADDSVTIQKVVGISFAGEDVTLITVDNGEDAITKAREVRPDLILADVVMPGKNGYEVCEAVKADPQLQHIPVLLLTGTFEAFDEERAQRSGAAGHVAKPFEAQTLLNEVNRLLAEAEAPRHAETSTSAPEPTPSPPETALPDPSESFEFFDDDLAGFSQPGEATSQKLADTDPLALSDAEFAFAKADSAAEPPPGQATAEELPAAPAWVQAERTVAIFPDELPDSPADLGPEAEAEAPSAEAELTTLDAVLEDTAEVTPQPPGAVDALELDPGEDLLAPATPSPASSGPASSAGDDDFEFDRMTVGLDASGGDSLPSVDSDDLARATVLDPAGSSGFAVSSSDLGSWQAAERPAAQPTAAADPALGPDLLAGEGEPPSVPEPAREVEPFPEPEPLARPTPSAEPEVEEAPEPLLEAEPLVEPEPFAEPEAIVEAQPLPEEAGAPSVAELAPELRERIHDSLEKIAWESFGDVAEKIVRQAIERVETIAWEVIPQMAETLVREEIRRMKGEAEETENS